MASRCEGRMDFLKVFLFTCFFIFYFLGTCFAQMKEKLGIDRIDAALPTHSNGELITFLMEQTTNLGVKHVKIWIPWIFLDDLPPSKIKPKIENGYIIVPGIRMEGWHKYRIKELDVAILEAKKNGLSVVLGIHGPPIWPRGENVCEYDLGTHEPCGMILQSHFEIFKNALFDFSFYMSQRYPEVEYWILYNEPNLPYAFLPQHPLPGGSMLDAYMELIFQPMADGLRANRNDVKLVGPEITLLDVENEFGKTKWLDDWIYPILRYYPNYFDIFSVHVYSVDAHQTIKEMSRLKLALDQFPYATQRVWLTEFNFGTEKEKLTQTDLHVFVNILWMLKYQWWERSYFFSFLGSVVYEEYWRLGVPKPIFFWLQRLLK